MLWKLIVDRLSVENLNKQSACYVLPDYRIVEYIHCLTSCINSKFSDAGKGQSNFTQGNVEFTDSCVDVIHLVLQKTQDEPYYTSFCQLICSYVGLVNQKLSTKTNFQLQFLP